MKFVGLLPSKRYGSASGPKPSGSSLIQRCMAARGFEDTSSASPPFSSVVTLEQVETAGAGLTSIAQARTFTETMGVTGIVLTKLDGTARGGVVIAIRKETGVPIRYVGVGEAVDDLRPFDARQFTSALFDAEAGAGFS